MRLTVVADRHSPEFFAATRDYILENRALYYADEIIMPMGFGRTEEWALTIMRKEKTTMRVVTTHPYEANDPFAGPDCDTIHCVAEGSEYANYTMYINGAYFNNVRAPGTYRSKQIMGQAVIDGRLSKASWVAQWENHPDAPNNSDVAEYAIRQKFRWDAPVEESDANWIQFDAVSPSTKREFGYYADFFPDVQAALDIRDQPNGTAIPYAPYTLDKSNYTEMYSKDEMALTGLNQIWEIEADNFGHLIGEVALSEDVELLVHAISTEDPTVGQGSSAFFGGKRNDLKDELELVGATMYQLDGGASRAIYRRSKGGPNSKPFNLSFGALRHNQSGFINDRCNNYILLKSENTL